MQFLVDNCTRWGEVSFRYSETLYKIQFWFYNCTCWGDASSHLTSHKVWAYSWVLSKNVTQPISSKCTNQLNSSKFTHAQALMELTQSSIHYILWCTQLFQKEKLGWEKKMGKHRWVLMLKLSHLLLSLILGSFWLSRKTKTCDPSQVTSLKDLKDSCFYVMFLMKYGMKNKVELGHFNVWMSESDNLNKSCPKLNTWNLRGHAK